MTTRNFRLRVVRIQIDIGKDAAVGVPPSDVHFIIVQKEFFPERASAIDDEFRVRPFTFCLSGDSRRRARAFDRTFRRARTVAVLETRATVSKLLLRAFTLCFDILR